MSFLAISNDINTDRCCAFRCPTFLLPAVATSQWSLLQNYYFFPSRQHNNNNLSGNPCNVNKNMWTDFVSDTLNCYFYFPNFEIFLIFKEYFSLAETLSTFTLKKICLSYKKYEFRNFRIISVLIREDGAASHCADSCHGSLEHELSL